MLLQGRMGAGRHTVGAALARRGFVEFTRAELSREVAIYAFNRLASALNVRLVVPVTMASFSALADESPLWLHADTFLAGLGEDVWLRVLVARVTASGRDRVVVTDFYDSWERLPALLVEAGYHVTRVKVVNPEDGPLPVDAHEYDRYMDARPCDRVLVNDEKLELSLDAWEI